MSEFIANVLGPIAIVVLPVLHFVVAPILRDRQHRPCPPDCPDCVRVRRWVEEDRLDQRNNLE